VEPAVRFVGITKRFPGAIALQDVSLDVQPGACHALCGENGAGKSTLGRVLAGIHAPDAGHVEIFGRNVSFANPRDALAAGVGMVHQELAFCDNLSVAENLCLAALPNRYGFLRRAEMAQRAERMLVEIGATLDVHRPMRELNIAQQQLIQIAAAVGSGARIIVFDEPTSSLSHVETLALFELIGRLRANGVTCIYVSHRMPEIFRLCSHVSILRDGRHVVTRPIVDLTEADLVQAMIGRTIGEYFPTHLHAAPTDELLRVESLSSAGRFHDVSFSLRAGEILGLAGLVGAGRSELAATIFGMHAPDSGQIYIRGIPVRIKSPAQAIGLGIGLVPEDRKRQGLVLSQSGVHNTSLPMLERLADFSWIRRTEERALVDTWFRRLRVRAPSPDAVVAGLSGGNQQKIVIAKWLAAHTGVLILDEPTRGVDVGAKAEIHALIDELAARGSAILLISSELPEVVALSTRVLVLRGGRVQGELPREGITQDRLMALMTGLARVNK
jgi:ABC-type sugar transport system ATPase subunit